MLNTNTSGSGRVVYTDQDGDGVYDDVVYTVPMNETAPTEVHYVPQTGYHSQPRSSTSALPKLTKKDIKRGGKIFAVLAAFGAVSAIIIALIVAVMYIL